MLLHWLCELYKNRQQINMLILLGFTLYTITHARINTDAPTHQHTQAHTYTHFKRSKECFSLHLFILLFSFRFVTGILYYLLSVYNVTQQVVYYNYTRPFLLLFKASTNSVLWQMFVHVSSLLFQKHRAFISATRER